MKFYEIKSKNGNLIHIIARHFKLSSKTIRNKNIKYETVIVTKKRDS